MNLWRSLFDSGTLLPFTNNSIASHSSLTGLDKHGVFYHYWKGYWDVSKTGTTEELNLLNDLFSLQMESQMFCIPICMWHLNITAFVSLPQTTGDLNLHWRRLPLLSVSLILLVPWAPGFQEMMGKQVSLFSRFEWSPEELTSWPN